MSSGFVPAGSDAASTKPDDAWVKAQQLVAQSRSSAESKPSKQEDGKSLYDVLQQNKGRPGSSDTYPQTESIWHGRFVRLVAAKQEAIEEAARLKNQFRSLDDDEVDFLDSVLESTRAKEAAVRKETAEQLEVFRKQREAAEKAQFQEDNDAAPNAGKAGSPISQETWAAKPKKRRRDKGIIPTQGAKLRKMSSTDSGKPDSPTLKTAATEDHAKTTPTVTPTNALETDVEPTTKPGGPSLEQKSTPAAVLGLGNYSSDEDWCEDSQTTASLSSTEVAPHDAEEACP
jgi:hypothetical protein